MRDDRRLMGAQEQVRTDKLEALRRAIHDGMASGPAEPHDMVAIKAEARTLRASGSKVAVLRKVLPPTTSS